MAEFDRFIPLRSAIDWDYASSELTWGPKKESKQDLASCSTPRRRILAFNNKNTTFSPSDDYIRSLIRNRKAAAAVVNHKPDRVLDALGFMDDENLNLIDWGSTNFLAIALDSTVHLWNPCSTSRLVTVDEDVGPITSLSWGPDGRRIAVGLDNSDVQLWDAAGNRLLRTLRGVHGSACVGSLAWNGGNLLTTGGADGRIVTNDVRLPQSDVVRTYHRGGHQQEICALKWCESGRQLASGGDDGLIHIWELEQNHRWVFRFCAGASARALAWCPFRGDLLATGGAKGGHINFWSTSTGTCVNSLQTCSSTSQVCALLWNKHKNEILSSCGGGNLTLWEYPSMARIARLVGHQSPVLSLCRSPDGCSVATVSGGMDESLRIWTSVFPPVPEAPAAKEGAFSNSNRIQIRFKRNRKGMIMNGEVEDTGISEKYYFPGTYRSKCGSWSYIMGLFVVGGVVTNLVIGATKVVAPTAPLPLGMGDPRWQQPQ